MKKKEILLIGDYDNWAFAHIIKWIVENLSDRYEFYYDFMIYNFWDQDKDWAKDKISLKSFFVKPIQALKNIKYWYKAFGYQSRKIKIGIKPKYDIVVFLDYYMDRKANFSFRTRKLVRGIFTDAFPPYGLVYDWKLKRYVREMTIEEFVKNYLNDIDALLLGSPFMLEFYKKYISRVYWANMIVDENKFKPFKKNDENYFIVGWVGNPSRPWKHFYDIVVPAVERFQTLRKNVVFKTQFSGDFDKLHEFYKDVDVIVNASSADVGPSMFMEASLCGIPTISTFMGIPAFVIKNNINGFIVNRNVDEFVEKLVFLYDNRDVLKSFKSRIRDDYIQFAGRQVMINNWKQMFEDLLNS